MFNFKKFKEEKFNNIRIDLINKIHDYDEEIYKKIDKNRYKVAKKCNRTVNTQIGFITFNRRIYWDTIEKRYICFTDEYFNIEKNPG